MSTLSEVPILMQKEKLDITVLKKLGMDYSGTPDLGPWNKVLKRLQNPRRQSKVVLVGKYVELPDAYISINESIKHAGAMNDCHVEVSYLHSENIDDSNYKELLKGFDGILVAPGFGDRGIEGKILAARYARENNVPFFGICLGLQCAVIEFARHVLKLEKAHSTEMALKTPDPVIDLMEDQKGVTEKGGTMRLGAYPCVIKPGTRTSEAYGVEEISERHRHRYEFNDKYLKDFEEAGMISTGVNPDTSLVEIMEITAHKWFIGVQFHPEYSSTVLKPHPLFVSFIKATLC
jgi:CTP synthase